MALRVLLADESSTIKRVMQLALHDFGVDVKAVPVGLDVLDLARSFKPDIIFADVLLAKRSGYDVCADIKNDPELSRVPTILMWSGFMEVDEARLKSARVDSKLEKPFDPDQLRKLVKELVPRLQTNAISDYVQFPNRPEFIEEAMPPVPSQTASRIDLSSLDEKDEFSHVPLPKSSSQTSNEVDGEEWSRSTLQQFKLPETDEISQEVINRASEAIQEQIENSGVFWASTGESVHENHDLPPAYEGLGMTSDEVQNIKQSLVPQLDFDRAEEIIRSQAREVLESIAWKILPDITERIVREELQKLLKDAERLDHL